MTDFVNPAPMVKLTISMQIVVPNTEYWISMGRQEIHDAVFLMYTHGDGHGLFIEQEDFDDSYVGIGGPMPDFLAEQVMINTPEILVPGTSNIDWRIIRDQLIEAEWERRDGVCNNGGLLIKPWFNFPPGTSIIDVRNWIDKHHSKGVMYLINGVEND